MYFFNPKGIVIPNTERLNNYSTEEGGQELKIIKKWGTVTYSVASDVSILKTVKVFSGYMAVESDGRAYRPETTTKLIISIDDFMCSKSYGHQRSNVF